MVWRFQKAQIWLVSKLFKPDLWSFEGCHRELWSALYFSFHTCFIKQAYIWIHNVSKWSSSISNFHNEWNYRSFIDDHKLFSLKFLGIGILSYLSYKSIHEFRMLSSKSNNKMELLLVRDSAAQVRYCFMIIYILLIY